MPLLILFLRWVSHVVRMEEGRSAFKILTDKLTGKIPLGSVFGELWNAVLKEKITNEVLEHIRKKETLLNKNLRRQVNWISDILRTNCLVHDDNERQVMEQKGFGTRKTQIFDGLKNRRSYLKQKNGRRKVLSKNFGRVPTWKMKKGKTSKSLDAGGYNRNER